MFKLVSVSGNNTSASYPLTPGLSTLGRQSDNSIVLVSERVSKKHCSIIVGVDGVTVKDEGSSNGTFVNGLMIKSKKIKAGDRISLGEFVLQLVEVSSSRPAHLSSSSILPNSKVNSSQSLDFSTAPVEAIPNDLKGKILWYFNHSLMPLFYGINMRAEWRVVCLGFFSALIIGNLGLSVYPLLEANRATLVREIKIRARFMSRQISEQNASFLAAGAETKADIGIIDQYEGVRVAVLVDLDNRIIAPGSRLNQYLTSGPEATAAVRARDLFRAGRETGLIVEDDSGVVVSIEPVKILSPALGKNVVTAMALVSIDTSLSTPGSGEIGITYFQTLIFTSLFGIIIFSILYKVTLKPFITLNEDIDRALKDDLPQVTHEYQFEELNSLWEIINSTIQRIPRKNESNLSSIGISGGSGSNSVEDYEWPIRMLGNVGKLGLIAFGPDKRIIHLNSVFEEVSGIRLEAAIGQVMSSVAREQSLGLFVEEMLDRVTTGSEGANEDYDFSGISYKVHVSAFGESGQAPRCILMVLERNE